MVDKTGGSARSGFHVRTYESSPSGFVALASNLQWLTKAELVEISLTRHVAFTGSVTTSGGLDVSDKAYLLFVDEDGRHSEISIPAPKTQVFMADGQTVNGAHPWVADLIASILLSCVSASGADLIAFQRGWRDRYLR
jgi:hypothetical protein